MLAELASDEVENERVRQELIATRYWNSNGYAVAAVARRGWAGDWTAYIGAQPDPASREFTCTWTARFGTKLGEDHALALFPDISLVYRP
jgi:hypothetical protein